LLFTNEFELSSAVCIRDLGLKCLKGRHVQEVSKANRYALITPFVAAEQPWPQPVNYKIRSIIQHWIYQKKCRMWNI